MNEFWFSSACPKGFKMTVFDAVVRSKLVYGLEGVQVPKFLLNKLDAFQLKGAEENIGLDNNFRRSGKHQQKSL